VGAAKKPPPPSPSPPVMQTCWAMRAVFPRTPPPVFPRIPPRRWADFIQRQHDVDNPAGEPRLRVENFAFAYATACSPAAAAAAAGDGSNATRREQGRGWDRDYSANATRGMLMTLEAQTSAALRAAQQQAGPSSTAGGPGAEGGLPLSRATVTLLFGINDLFLVSGPCPAFWEDQINNYNTGPVMRPFCR
jgi:hypothetical protein